MYMLGQGKIQQFVKLSFNQSIDLNLHETNDFRIMLVIKQIL